MRIIILILIFLFLISVSTMTYNAIFALTWMAGHCQYLGRKCDQNKYEQWDHQSFTIHGLWPTQQTYHDYGDFNFGLFKGDLLQDMYNYWPPQAQTGGLPHFLWDIQWKKFGHRYASLMLDLSPQKFNMYGIKKRNQELQIHFFTKVIEFYKDLNVRKLQQDTYTKDQFSVLINVPAESFYFVCLDSGSFRQVRICYKITRAGLTLRKCAKEYSNCDDEIAQLSDWREDQEIIIEQEPSKLTDAEQQQKMSKIVPIYEPVEQKKQDESIIVLNVETNKSSNIKQEIKQDLLIQEEKQINIEIQLSYIEPQEDLDQIIKELQQKEVYDNKAVVQIVTKYIVETAIIVSMFWFAIIIICIKIFRKNRQEEGSQLKENQNTNVNIQDKQIQ